MAITGLTASHVVYDEYATLDTISIFAASAPQGSGTFSAVPSNLSGSSFVNADTWATKAYTDHKIQGKPFIVEQTYPELQFQNLGPDWVKYELCKMMVEELFAKGAIEFTTEKEPHTGDVKVRARIFATENSDVRILRINNLIK